MTLRRPRPLVLTGATGFVGRRVVAALAARPTGSLAVTLLTRDAQPRFDHPLPADWVLLPWDIGRHGDRGPPALPEGAIVVHLAAATGTRPAGEQYQVNLEGTRQLLDAARAAQATHFLHVSSIAVGFANQRWYPYARSKRAAEALVRDSGLPVTIVRPTMVFGTGSPVQTGLERLALGAWALVPGGGEVLVQPIDVEDLAGILLNLAEGPARGGEPLDLGGPERLPLRDLLDRIRLIRGRPSRRLWSVPVGPIRAALAALGALSGARLPVTAGQFASFLNDSTATGEPAGADLALTPLDQMLGGATADGDRAQRNLVIEEFAVFARHLGTRTPGDSAVAAYLTAHPRAARPAGDGVDRRLLRLARRGHRWCALADAYARLFRPWGPLRRRVVLALAVLESSPETHGGYDRARPGALAATWLALGLLGARGLALSLLAVGLLGPVHLGWRLRGVEPADG